MESILPIFIVIVIIVFIGVVIYLFLKGDEVIHTGKHLSTKDAGTTDSKGFGVYRGVYVSPCATSTGKCTEPGIQWLTEYCQAHPETGRGCLDENGEQTFAARSSSQTCYPLCRSFVLNETTNPNSVCNYDYPYNLPAYNCVTANARTAFYRTFECDKNDTTGDNACTYRCSSSGTDSNGIYGDADPNKISYIPQCQANPKSTVTLKQIPWNNILDLGVAGVSIKGYTITNIINNGVVDSINFNIAPAYNQWIDGGQGATNVITYQQLIELDSTLTLYENCNISGSNSKSLCSNYYTYVPTQPESDTTFVSTPSLCKLNSNFPNTKDCFYNPWYVIPGTVVPGGTGLFFANPYVGHTAGNTGASYTWTNIGNYGYNAIPTTCSTNPLKLTGTTGPNNNEYVIPDTPINGATCLNLRALPPQCSNTYTGIFSVPASVTLSRQIEQEIIDWIGETGPYYNRPTLSTYPQTSSTTNFICQTEYPDGTTPLDLNGNPIPGCVQTCRYMPPNNIINFESVDDLGNKLGSTGLYNLLGNYISLNYIDNTNKEYFLSVDNIMCGVTGGYLPLQSCLNTPSSSIQMPLTYIYSGGTGIAAGNYWSKNNCDQESIELTTNMRLLFSPRNAINIPFNNEHGFTCDIYAFVGGMGGYLTPTNQGGIPTTVDMNSLFYGSNIVASSKSGSSSNLYFNNIGLGNEIPRTNGTEPAFILMYNPTTGVYTISGYDPVQSLSIDKYDGITYTPTTFSFSFVDESNKTANQAYFKYYGFTEPVIKSPGTLYAGKNVTNSILQQRNNQCYRYSNCLSSNVGQTCYPETCNLFYEYNKEFCGA